MGGSYPRGDPRREILTDVFLDHVPGIGIVMVRLADRSRDPFRVAAIESGFRRSDHAARSSRVPTVECVEHDACSPLVGASPRVLTNEGKVRGPAM